MYDVTIVRPCPDENRIFCSGVRIVARASRQASDNAATSSLTLGVPQRDNLRRQERLDDKRSGEKRISDVRRRLECGQPIIYFRRPRSYRLLTQNRFRRRVGKPPADTPTRQISAQSPRLGGRAKTILAMVALLFSPFLANMRFCRRSPLDTSTRLVFFSFWQRGKSNPFFFRNKKSTVFLIGLEII